MNNQGSSSGSGLFAAAGDPPSFCDPWAEAEPPPWPEGILPPGFEATIAAMSLRDGTDYGALCMALLAATSGAAPKNARFYPYGSDWWVPPVIWVMTIAESGKRKTALRAMFGPLLEMHTEMAMAHRAAMRDWQALSDEERRKSRKPREPAWRICEDYTPESLQQILANTDLGVLLLRDELAGFFDFDRYRAGSAASTRAFILQAYDGESYTVHRVGRGAVTIKTNAITLFGNIQPTRLADFDGMERDGLAQRLLPVRILAVPEPRPGVPVDGREAIDAAIRRLAAVDAQTYTTTQQGQWSILKTQHQAAKYAELIEYGVGFQGFCDKLHGTHARLALILHLLDDPTATVIPTETVNRAERLVTYFLLKQTREFYEAMGDAPLKTRRDIAGWLLTKTPVRVLASDLVRNVRACRALTTKQLHAILEPLVVGGWLEPVEPYPSNRAWMFDQRVPIHFADRTDLERERRKAVRDLFAQINRDPPAP